MRDKRVDFWEGFFFLFGDFKKLNSERVECSERFFEFSGFGALRNFFEDKSESFKKPSGKAFVDGDELGVVAELVGDLVDGRGEADLFEDMVLFLGDAPYLAFETADSLAQRDGLNRVCDEESLLKRFEVFVKGLSKGFGFLGGFAVQDVVEVASVV